MGPQLIILIKSDCLQIISQSSMISEGDGKWATIRDSFLFFFAQAVSPPSSTLPFTCPYVINPNDTMGFKGALVVCDFQLGTVFHDDFNRVVLKRFISGNIILSCPIYKTCCPIQFVHVVRL